MLELMDLRTSRAAWQLQLENYPHRARLFGVGLIWVRLPAFWLLLGATLSQARLLWSQTMECSPRKPGHG